MNEKSTGTAIFLTLILVVMVACVASWKTETATAPAAAAGHEEPRSPEWPKVRKEFLEKHPVCEACGYSGPGLQAHHVEPFHLFPAKELSPDNLIALCGPNHHNCHFLFGHAGVDYKAWNPHVRDDVKRYADRMKECRDLLKKEEERQQE